MSDEDEGNKNRNEDDSGSKVSSTPSSDSVNVSISDVGSDGLDDMLKGMDDDLNDLTGVHDSLDEGLKKKIDMGSLSKEEFNSHLQGKIKKLGDRLKILQIKYQSYKSWYDKLNVMIIVISSLLSIFEAFRNEMKDIIEGDKLSELFFSMIPIGISSFITCSAAIIKFKKYQEKMENMLFTREKVILSISKMKHIQELTKFRNEENLYKIKKKYIDDIYGFYNESTSELERHIKYSDHFKLFDLEPYKPYQPEQPDKQDKKGKKNKQDKQDQQDQQGKQDQQDQQDKP